MPRLADTMAADEYDRLRELWDSTPVASSSDPEMPRWVACARDCCVWDTGESIDRLPPRVRTRILVAACDAAPRGDEAVIVAVYEVIESLGLSRD